MVHTVIGFHIHPQQAVDALQEDWEVGKMLRVFAFFIRVDIHHAQTDCQTIRGFPRRWKHHRQRKQERQQRGKIRETPNLRWDMLQLSQGFCREVRTRRQTGPHLEIKTNHLDSGRARRFSQPVARRSKCRIPPQDMHFTLSSNASPWCPHSHPQPCDMTTEILSQGDRERAGEREREREKEARPSQRCTCDVPRGREFGTPAPMMQWHPYGNEGAVGPTQCPQ